MAEISSIATENRLPPADEARVRTAAQVAADRMGWSVPRQVLDYIIATSNPKESPAALEVRAAGIVEYVKNHPDAPMMRNDADKAAQGFLKIVHGQVVSHFGGLPWALAAREESSSSTGTSSKYDALYSGSDWNSEAGKRYMRDYAQKSGMGWAPDDLLRLGPGAIDTLKQAHFRKESFQNLKDAGYQGREAAEVAVGISRYAIKHKLDAHRITDETKGAVKDFGQGDPQQEKEWRDRFKKFFDDPEDSKTRQELDGKLEHFERHGTPKQRERAKSFRGAAKLERQATLAADAETAKADKREVRANLSEAKAVVREAAVDQKSALLDSLLDDDTPSVSNTQTAAQPSQQKAEAKLATASEKAVSEPAPPTPPKQAAAPKSAAAPKPA